MVDAVVVGSGPNGLAAAVTLARADLSVQVFEGADHLGGGSATRELTRPGGLHDVCSAVHPMAFVGEFSAPSAWLHTTVCAAAVTIDRGVHRMARILNGQT